MFMAVSMVSIPMFHFVLDRNRTRNQKVEHHDVPDQERECNDAQIW